MTEMNSEIEWIGGKPCGCIHKRKDGYGKKWYYEKNQNYT